MSADIEQCTAPTRTWWVYMVRAENGHLYTGISVDPQRRFEQHQRGKGARFSIAARRQRWCGDVSASIRATPCGRKSP